jgi:hypothetical protein
MRPTDGTASDFDRAVLDYDRYCSEIVTQTDLLMSCIEGADLTVPVPSRPGWNGAQS